MTDETEKVAVDPETVFKRPRECDSPSYQKRQKMALLARKQGAGDSLTAGSAMSKEKKYEKIFKLLEGVQGPIEVKKLFFESIIKEAARCMSRDFVQLLEKKLEHMIWEYLSMEDYDNSNA
ncbi:PREDICTED: cancer/testis antigen family 45 member A3-like [Cercocebus atys]|uniref:cancer/testis antigen family 45 member A3-like n=1 Tax=Cercocebus atys TaxID=9531 RepID=UPI0005F3F0A9|nr:PREDICTED: cancer/testis antigen family 45 member A3-like [Cercocebus atys]